MEPVSTIMVHIFVTALMGGKGSVVKMVNYDSSDNIENLYVLNTCISYLNRFYYLYTFM